jgi:hypothetical protein
MPVRAATRAFPQKGPPLPDAATPKGKFQNKKSNSKKILTKLSSFKNKY